LAGLILGILPWLSGCGCDDVGASTQYTTASCTPADLPFGGGNGSRDKPFLVCTAAQFENIASSPLLKHYLLTADIDLSDEPVRVLTRFVGKLDGGGHALKGLVADGSAGETALFHEQRGEIVDLRMVDAQVRGVAMLAATNHGLIQNCELSGSVEQSEMGAVGTVAGVNHGTIIDVRVDATVRGISNVGGIVGNNSATGRVEHAQFQGDVQGGSLAVGGIAGTSHGILYDVHARADVAMIPGVGRATGGIVGFLGGGAVLDLASAEGDIYSEDSAGGIVGRTRHGLVSRARFAGSVLANHSAGGLVGLVSFGGTFAASYATGEIAISSLGDGAALGTSCKQCLFLGTVGGIEQNVITGETTTATVSSEQLTQPGIYAEFDDGTWLTDPNTLSSAGHARLAWELDPPEPTAPSLRTVTFKAFTHSNATHKRGPKTLRFVNQETGASVHAVFGRESERDPWSFAVAHLPPGEYEYAVADDWDDWCTLESNSSAAPERWLPLAVTDQDRSISPSVNCGQPRVYLHPGLGTLLREPAPGTVMFEDDGENGSALFTTTSKWNLAADLACGDSGQVSGSHGWYFGIPSKCHFYEHGTGSGSTDEGWLTTEPIPGIVSGTKLSFYSYRDLGPRDTARVELVKVGWGADETIVVWEQYKDQPADRAWQKIEVTLEPPHNHSSGEVLIPNSWNGLAMLRFVAITDYAADQTDHVGWIIDDVSLVK